MKNRYRLTVPHAFEREDEEDKVEPDKRFFSCLLKEMIQRKEYFDGISANRRQDWE